MGLWHALLLECLLASVAVVSLSSNSLLQRCFSRSSEIRACAPGLFILNLSMCNILSTVRNVPWTRLELSKNQRPFGDSLCRVASFTDTFWTTNPMLSMAALGVDRWAAVAFPLTDSSSVRHKHAAVTLAYAWVHSLALSTVPALFSWTDACTCSGWKPGSSSSPWCFTARVSRSRCSSSASLSAKATPKAESNLIMHLSLLGLILPWGPLWKFLLDEFEVIPRSNVQKWLQPEIKEHPEIFSFLFTFIWLGIYAWWTQPGFLKPAVKKQNKKKERNKQKTLLWSNQATLTSAPVVITLTQMIQHTNVIASGGAVALINCTLYQNHCIINCIITKCSYTVQYMLK